VILPDIEWSVGDQGFAGCLGKDDLAGDGKYSVEVVAALERDEEELARASTPAADEVCIGEEDAWGIGEAAPEDHGTTASFDEG
jgi:hypothetical protein